MKHLACALISVAAIAGIVVVIVTGNGADHWLALAGLFIIAGGAAVAAA